jgi:hypothetical protein
VFVPAQPLAEPKDEGPSTLLNADDERRLLAAQNAELDAKIDKIDQQFATIDELLSKLGSFAIIFACFYFWRNFQHVCL